MWNVICIMKTKMNWYRDGKMLIYHYVQHTANFGVASNKQWWSWDVMCSKKTCVSTTETNRPGPTTRQSQPSRKINCCCADLCGWQNPLLAHRRRDKDHRKTIHVCVVHSWQEIRLGLESNSLKNIRSPHKVSCLRHAKELWKSRMRLAASRQVAEIACTVLLLMTFTHKHGLIIADLSSHNLWEKQVRSWCVSNMSTYQCSILFNNMGSFIQKSEFRKPENLNTSLSPKVKSSMSRNCHFSENSAETTTRIWYWQQRPTVTDRRKAVVWGLCFGGMPLKQKQWSVSPRKNWFHRLCSSPSEMKWRKTTNVHLQRWDALYWPRLCCFSPWRYWPQHHRVQFRAHGKLNSRPQGEQLVTRSGVHRVRCCVCHLHHEQAMKAPYRVPHFFAKVFQEGATL